MSQSLWEKLPTGFLKKGIKAYNRLDYEVQLLIVELAKNQNFKCAFCSTKHGLIIEHDHDPFRGDGDRPTIHNIRGLTCQRCNWHLGLYEIDERGEHRAWDHVYPNIDSDHYQTYIYHYECRIRRLHEDFLEETCPNYWNRKPFLDKFDAWKDEWGNEDYPWHWGFEEIKEKRHGEIRTPAQLCKTIIACMKCVVEEKQKDPNFQPPESFFKMMDRLKPLMETLQEAELRQSIQ